MPLPDAISLSPFELKQQGKFAEALKAYTVQFAKAVETENSYIARTCFDQMLDIVLLQLYLERAESLEGAASLRNLAKGFLSTSELKRTAQQRLRELVPWAKEDGTLDEYFRLSWDKFTSQREGKFRGFSVRKEQLVGAVGQSNDP